MSTLILRFSHLFAFNRIHKHYYYTNKVTGDSQWEYPADEFGGDMDVDAPSEETTGEISVAPPAAAVVTVTSQQESAPVWSYPGDIVYLIIITPLKALCHEVYRNSNRELSFIDIIHFCA